MTDEEKIRFADLLLDIQRQIDRLDEDIRKLHQTTKDEK